MRAAAIALSLMLAGCGAIPDGEPAGTPPPSYTRTGGGIPVAFYKGCNDGVWEDRRIVTAAHCADTFPRFWHDYGADIAFGPNDGRDPPVWRDAEVGEAIDIYCDISGNIRRYRGIVLNPSYQTTPERDGRFKGIYITLRVENAGINYLQGCSGTTIYAHRGGAVGVLTIVNTHPPAHRSDWKHWNAAGIPTSRLAELAEQSE